MRGLVAAILASIALHAVLAADIRAFNSPEAAYEAYEHARMRKDIPAFLASINFRQEAMETLRRSGSQITDADVEELAQKKESELRRHLEKRGFIAYGKCEAVTKFQDSDTQVRIVRLCKDATGATFVPVRLMRFTDGWLVVRG